MKGAILKAGATVLYYSKALRLLRIGQEPGLTKRQFPFLVLLYHRVNPDADPLFPGLSVRAFEAQMSFLADRCQVLPLQELVARLRDGDPIPPWTAAVTFDDGYRDNFLYAHPVLKKLGLRATLFVSTGYIGTGEVLWNDRISWAVKQTRKTTVEFQFRNGREVFGLDGIGQRTHTLERILESLKPYPDAEKKVAVDGLIKELRCADNSAVPLMLSWDELRRMDQEGWGIGSHTVTHPILSRVDLQQVRQELEGSKHSIESELQVPVELMAYPNGKRDDFTPAVKNLVRECGFKGAVTTLGGFNAGPVDPFEIARQSPWDDHLPRFAVKLSWPFWKAMCTFRLRVVPV